MRGTGSVERADAGRRDADVRRRTRAWVALVALAPALLAPGCVLVRDLARNALDQSPVAGVVFVTTGLITGAAAVVAGAPFTLPVVLDSRDPEVMLAPAVLGLVVGALASFPFRPLDWLLAPLLRRDPAPAAPPQVAPARVPPLCRACWVRPCACAEWPPVPPPSHAASDPPRACGCPPSLAVPRHVRRCPACGGVRPAEEVR